MDGILSSQWTKKSVRKRDFLSSRVAVLSGGQDRSGRSLVTIDGHEQMVHPLSIADLVDLVEYLVQTLPRDNWNRGLAVLMNARNCDQDCVQSVVSVIDQLQMRSVCPVAVFYVAQSKISKLQSFLKKMVGSRNSKTNPKIATFQTVITKDFIQLQRYIDVDQLTADFGGILRFSHSEWVRFIQTMDEFDERMRGVLNRIPKAMDEMNMLLEYELSSPLEDEQLLLQIRSRYNEIMQRLNLEHAIDECKALAETLRDAPGHKGLCEIGSSPSVAGALDRLRLYEARLIEGRTELKATWQRAELRIIALAKLNKYRGKAEKIMLWIEDVGTTLLASVPTEGGEVKEDDKSNFIENILPATKNVIWLSENIRRKMRQIVTDSKSCSQEIADFDQHFNSTIEKFRKETKRKELNIGGSQISSSAPVFSIDSILPYSNGAAQKQNGGLFDCLQQLNEWYRASLEYLSLHHPPYQIQTVSGFQELFYKLSSTWSSALKEFLDDHSLPSTDHLQRLKSIIPVMDSRPARNNARALINRVELLIKLFAGRNLLTLEDMDEICSWQVESAASGNQNLVQPECDDLDHQQLTSAKQRISPALKPEHFPIAAANVCAVKNSEKGLQGSSNSVARVIERRRSRIDPKERDSLLNPKIESSTFADAYKPPVLTNERHKCFLSGNDPTPVERYISLDSRSINLVASGNGEVETKRDRLLQMATLHAPSVTSRTGGNTFESNSTVDKAVSLSTVKEPKGESFLNTALKDSSNNKTDKDGSHALATKDIFPNVPTLDSSTNMATNDINPDMATKYASCNMAAKDRSPTMTTKDKFIVSETENKAVETTTDTLAKCIARAESRLGNAHRNETNEFATKVTQENRKGLADVRSVIRSISTQNEPSHTGVADDVISKLTAETVDKTSDMKTNENSVAVTKTEVYLCTETIELSACKKGSENYLENSADMTLQTPMITRTGEKSNDIATSQELPVERVHLRRKPPVKERKESIPGFLSTTDCLRLIADSSLKPEHKLRVLSRLSKDLDQDFRHSPGGPEGKGENGAWRNCLSLYSKTSLERSPPENRSHTLPQDVPSRSHNPPLPFCRPLGNTVLESPYLTSNSRPPSTLSSDDMTYSESLPSSALSLAFDEIMQGKTMQNNRCFTSEDDQEEENKEEEDEEENDYDFDISSQGQSSASMRGDYNSASDTSSPTPQVASFDSMNEHIQRLKIATTNRKLDAFELAKDRIRLQKLLSRNDP